jgi:CheY-like chemotaxis protein
MTAQHPDSQAASLDLEAVVRDLHVGGIRVGIQTSDAGLEAWISDRLHRVRVDREFDLSGKESWREDSVALWLRRAARRLFADNDPRRFRGGSKITATMAERSIAPIDGQVTASPQPRLLIVEDEPVVAWGLGKTARELGWKVCATVSTQEAAVEAASHLKPDAILMDYRLGDGGDGVTAARRIREGADIPIIFCTAYVRWLPPELLSVPRTQLIGKPARASSLREALAWAIAIRSAQ